MSSVGGIPAVALVSLFEGLEDGVCLTEGERVLYWNPAARELLGVLEDEVKPESFCGLLCGQIRSKEGADCSRTCPIRFSSNWPRSSTVNGQRRGRNLRVRCLKIPLAHADPLRPGVRLTIIEDVSKHS